MKRPDLEPRLIQAVVNYGLDRIEPDFGPGPDADILRALWVGIRPVLSADWQRFENGSRSEGAPKGNQNARKDKQHRKSPIVPGLDEVLEFWRAEGLSGDASQFFYHYDGQGWKWVANWKSVAMEWSIREKSMMRRPSAARQRTDIPNDPSQYQDTI